MFPLDFARLTGSATPAGILPDTAWATIIYILVFYHVILVFRILMSSQKKGLSLSIGGTIVTHMACVGLVIGMAMGRHYIPYFGIIRYLLPGIAPFEANWLFSGGRKPEKAPNATRAAKAEVIDAALLTGTAEDYDAWLQYLAHRNPSSARLGMTMREEYGLWLAARAESRGKVGAGGMRS